MASASGAAPPASRPTSSTSPPVAPWATPTSFNGWTPPTRSWWPRCSPRPTTVSSACWISGTRAWSGRGPTPARPRRWRTSACSTPSPWRTSAPSA
uniref:Uncharacterized protein n=1 Tax=Arundo donax TaxID=35708 RepID=A0A0A9G1B3_ARUDO